MKKMTLTSKISAAPGSMVISGMIVGAAIFALPMIILAPTAKEKKVCDQAVNTLFTTTDAIELQRAMFLIRRLDCKISTRL
jgi:ABC-type tungstate transport system substrate-binding protein